MASKAKKPRKINGYKMPEPIPTGYVVKNNQKKAWTVGNSIGKGGFGEIYCCSKYNMLQTYLVLGCSTSMVLVTTVLNWVVKVG